MFLEHAVQQAVDVSKPIRVLDLCAAPGGKSTHLLSLLNDTSLLVSNEVIRSRASILSENIQKWGHANVVVTNSDPQDFQHVNGYFDLVVIDAPCSGEGLFRKEPDAMKEWSDDNIRLCTLRQRRILSDVWPALKENGILIYSTCTYSEEENEGNLQWLSDNQDVEFVKLGNLPSGVMEVTHQRALGYRLMPHRLDGEGFFISVIRKKGEEQTPRIKAGKFQPYKAKELAGWLQGDFEIIQQNDLLIALPAASADEISWLSQHVTVVTKGVAVAVVKQNKLVPEHALALSTIVNRENFDVAELSRGQALAYLRKETLSPFDDQRGFALVQFEGNALGWINRLGNRLNNLYPQNWRIRMGPEGPTPPHKPIRPEGRT